MKRIKTRLPYWIMIRYYRWKVFHTDPGSVDRCEIVREYMNWQRKRMGSLDRY